MAQKDIFALFSDAKHIDYPDQEIILHAEDVPSGVYLICSGFVKSVSYSRIGDEKIHAFFKSGEIFPLSWVLNGVHEQVYYQAVGNVIVQRVAREHILDHLHTSVDVLLSYTQLVVKMLSVYSNRIYNLEFVSAKERVVARLLSLAERFGEIFESGVRLSIPITHKEIASTVGLSRETVTRALRELEDQGYIITEHKMIIIRSVERLRTLVV